MAAGSMTKEEVEDEIARLRRKLAKRERRAQKREEMKAKIERSNREWQVGLTKSPSEDEEQSLSQEKDLFEDVDVCPEPDAAVPSQVGTQYSMGFVLASQLPMDASASVARRRNRRSIRGDSSTPNVTRPKRRRLNVTLGHGTDTDGLAHLRVRDANNLPPINSDAELPEGWSFQMPQPNPDKLLKRTDFSLPKEYTSMKLETTRTREILSQSLMADEESEDSQASQSILAPRRRSKRRKAKKKSPEAAAPVKDNDDSVDSRMSVSEDATVIVDRREESRDVDGITETLDSVNVALWSQFSTSDGDEPNKSTPPHRAHLPLADATSSPDEEEFLCVLLGDPPPGGWVAAQSAAKAKRPRFKLSPVKIVPAPAVPFKF